MAKYVAGPVIEQHLCAALLPVELCFNFSPPQKAHCLYFPFLLTGPDLDDYSKNGKKAAEAMSLSKEGESVIVVELVK